MRYRPPNKSPEANLAPIRAEAADGVDVTTVASQLGHIGPE
jgi:hypothetical protein